MDEEVLGLVIKTRMNTLCIRGQTDFEMKLNSARKSRTDSE